MNKYFFRSNRAEDGMTGVMLVSCKNLTRAREYARAKFKSYGYKGKAVRVAALTFAFLICAILNVAAETKADTLKVDNAQITKIVEAETTTSKGKTIKYYFIYRGELVNTSKTVVAKYKLAKQYNANCALAIVIKGKSTKRIILD